MISILYAEGAAFCAILLFLILLRTNSVIEFSTTGRIFKVLVSCSCLFTIIDCLWGLTACSEVFVNITIFSVSTYLFHTCSSLIALVWFMFSLQYLGKKYYDSFALRIIPFFLLAFEIAIIISSAISNNMFEIGENYEYIVRPVRYVLFASQFMNYFIILILSIVSHFTQKDEEHRLYSQNAVVFSIISLTTCAGQCFMPASPIYSLGFTTSAFIIYAYIINHETNVLMVAFQNQKNQEEYQEKLRRDFSVLSCLSGYYDFLAIIDASDNNLKILNVSERFHNLLPNDDTVIPGTDFDVVLNAILKKEDIESMIEALGHDKAIETLSKVRRMSFDFMATFNKKTKAKIRLYLAIDKDNINNVILGIRDVTAEYHLEQTIEDQKKVITNLEVQNEMSRMIAGTDGLTGLSSKLTFIEEVESYLARNSSENCALIFFDMDHFKKINDLFGHEMGDTALREMAKKLRTLFRSDEMIGRMGGDEFCIFLPLISQRLVEERIKQMNKTLIAEYSDNDNKIKTSASIGCAYCESGDKTYVEMHSVADKAMYEVKKKGRNNSVIKVI